MDNSSNTTARLGVFVFLMMVFGIVLLIATIIDQSPRQPVYLPMVVRPTTLAGSQVVYPAPLTYRAEKNVPLETENPRLYSWKIYQPLAIRGIARQWL
jgi:hypothetical protein